MAHIPALQAFAAAHDLPLNKVRCNYTLHTTTTHNQVATVAAAARAAGLDCTTGRCWKRGAGVKVQLVIKAPY